MSNLDQLLSEHLPDEEARQAAVAALVSAGVKDKSLVERATKSSFAQGQTKAKTEFEAKFAELQERLNQVAGEKQQEPQTPVPQNPVNSATDPTSVAFAKELAELKKEFKAVVQFTKELKDQNQRLTGDLRQREIDQKVYKMLGDAGVEEPHHVYALMKSQAKIVPDPAGAGDGSGLMVLKPDRDGQPSDEPLSGMGTYTSAEDFVRSFLETSTGKRFLPAKQKSTAGSDVGGGGEGDAPSFSRSSGWQSLSDSDKRKAFAEIGIDI